jgi:hypothetical protein
MMQQELSYQPNFGKVTALSISRRVVAVTIMPYYWGHFPQLSGTFTYLP